MIANVQNTSQIVCTRTLNHQLPSVQLFLLHAHSLDLRWECITLAYHSTHPLGTVGSIIYFLYTSDSVAIFWCSVSLLSVISMFPNEPIAEDRSLKLLLASMQFRVLLGFLCVEVSPCSSPSLALAMTSFEMLLRQKGQAGDGKHKVVGLGLLWQHKARTQWAHIWCLQSWSSMAQALSKQMEHSSASPSCKSFPLHETYKAANSVHGELTDPNMEALRWQYLWNIIIRCCIWTSRRCRGLICCFEDL